MFKKTATQGQHLRTMTFILVNDEESDMYEELKERHPRVLYKLKVSEDPTSKDMPHEEEFDDDNYKSIDETAV